jgi:hypothetical protein
MKRWRCNNAACKQGEFAADLPVCPGCAVDARNPRYAGVVTGLAVIHFDPPDPVVPAMGQNVLACDPSKPIGGHMASGAHDAVNCPACRGSEAFRASYRAPLAGGSPQDAVIHAEGDQLRATKPG